MDTGLCGMPLEVSGGLQAYECKAGLAVPKQYRPCFSDNYTALRLLFQVI